MSGTHVFSDLWYHVNWHCKDDACMITANLEPHLFSEIEAYCKKTKGIHFEEVGGTETHIHLLFRGEPFVTLSDFIGKLKGASAHDINARFGEDALRWQRGYGIFSVSPQYFDAVITYINNQAEHHKELSFQDEYRMFLKKYNIEFDERYVWD